MLWFEYPCRLRPHRKARRNLGNRKTWAATSWTRGSARSEVSGPRSGQRHLTPALSPRGGEGGADGWARAVRWAWDGSSSRGFWKRVCAWMVYRSEFPLTNWDRARIGESVMRVNSTDLHYDANLPAWLRVPDVLAFQHACTDCFPGFFAGTFGLLFLCPFPRPLSTEPFVVLVYCIIQCKSACRA